MINIGALFAVSLYTELRTPKRQLAPPSWSGPKITTKGKAGFGNEESTTRIKLSGASFEGKSVKGSL